MRYSALVLAFIYLSFQAGLAGAIDLSNEKAKLSYSLGAKTHENFKTQSIDIDAAAFAQGMQDSDAGKMQLSPEQAQIVINEFQKTHVAKMRAKEEATASKNLEEAKQFFKKNRSQHGVQTTASGLQYRILQKGKGQSPADNDHVTVNYEGKLLNGEVFDSSYKRNQAATFSLNGLIPGWREALKMMKPGSKWELFIPPELAYGSRGAGPLITPNSALIFQVELVTVKADATP